MWQRLLSSKSEPITQLGTEVKWKRVAKILDRLITWRLIPYFYLLLCNKSRIQFSQANHGSEALLGSRACCSFPVAAIS